MKYLFNLIKKFIDFMIGFAAILILVIFMVAVFIGALWVMIFIFNLIFDTHQQDILFNFIQGLF